MNRPRFENRVAITCARGSLIGLGLERLLDPLSCETDPLCVPARDAHEAAIDCERLLARAASALVVAFTEASERVVEFPRHAVRLDREVMIFRGEAESEPVDPMIAGLVNEVTRATRKSFRSMALTVRLNCHRALRELDQAIEAAPPGQDRDIANVMAAELLELAERSGLADDHPLERLWPRLVARVVQVERTPTCSPVPIRSS